ncbi:MAG: hypothetical protein QM755_12960 [Luteolibacter sp.]
MATKTKAFFKGGFGCLAVFIICGLLVVAFGGRMHIDLGGAIMLLVVGGLIGLICNWIYQKGRRDSGSDSDEE